MSQIVGRGKTINKLLNVTNQAAPIGNQDNHPVKLGRGNLVMSPKTVSKPVGAVSLPSVNRDLEVQEDQFHENNEEEEKNSENVMLTLEEELKGMSIFTPLKNKKATGRDIIDEYKSLDQISNSPINHLADVDHANFEEESASIIKENTEAKFSEGSFLTKDITIKSETDKAEMEWQIYKCERRIAKVLKNVTQDNLGNVVEELEKIVEERPLSSRYANCSEIKKFVEVLMQKAIESDEFLEFAPCLIKMTAGHALIEFKQYFHGIAEQKRQENITLCASDDSISTSGQRFCRLLGKLIVLPRQTSNGFYDVVRPFVENCIEEWTYPQELQAVLDGIPENLAVVYALATKYLLVEIGNKVLQCDTVLEKLMERYLWLVRESILNSKIPKKLREVFLDSYIEIQNSGQQPTEYETTTTTDIETSEVESENGDVVIEEVEEESLEPEVHEEIEKGKENHLSAKMEIVVPEETSELKIPKSRNAREDLLYLQDQYLCVKYLLHELDSSDILPQFMENRIDDSMLTLPGIRERMQKHGFKPFFAFQFNMKYSGIGFEKLQHRAVDYAKGLMLENESTMKDNENVEEQLGPSRTQSRLAMNFNVKKREGSNSSDARGDVPTRTELSNYQAELNDPSDQLDSSVNSELNEELSNHSDSDIVIEDEYEDTDNSSQNYVVSSQESVTIENEIQPPEVKNESNTAGQTAAPGKFPLGRGRGMIRLPYSSKPKPVANVTPIQHHEGNWRKPHQNSSDYSFSINREKYTNKKFQRNDFSKRPRHGRQGFQRRENRGPKYRAIHHPKPQVQSDNEEKFGFKGGFGSTKPVQCTKCESYGHTADSCRGTKLFF